MQSFKYQFPLVTGLFATLFIIFLAGDIWVWKGSLLQNLSAQVAEEGGEQAFWGAAVVYCAIILFALAVALFSARWFRYVSLTLVSFLLLSSISKLLGGFDEYNEVGWYFCVLFCAQVCISSILLWVNFNWVRSKE